MAQLFIEFKKAPYSHLTYLIFLIVELQKIKPDLIIVTSCSPNVAKQLMILQEKKFVSNICFSNNVLNRDLANMRQDYLVQWHGNVTTLYMCGNYYYKHHFLFGSGDDKGDGRANCLSDASVIDLLQHMLRYFGVISVKTYFFWEKIHRSNYVNQLINKKIDSKKTVIFFDINKSELETFLPFYYKFITSCIESDEYTFLILGDDKGRLPKSPFCHYLKSSVSFYEIAHLIKKVDIVITGKNSIDHLAASLKRPVFLILKFSERFDKDKSILYTPYFKLFYLKESNFKQLNANDIEQKKCLELLNEFKNDISLNNRQSSEEIKYLFLLKNNFVGVIFDTESDFHTWRKENKCYDNLIEPIFLSQVNNVFDIINNVTKKNINIVIGDLSFAQIFFIKCFLYYNYKSYFNIINQPIIKKIPFSFYLSQIKEHS